MDGVVMILTIIAQHASEFVQYYHVYYRASNQQPVSTKVYLVGGSTLSLLPIGIVTLANSHDPRIPESGHSIVLRLTVGCIFLPAMDVCTLTIITLLLIAVEKVLEDLDWFSTTVYSQNF